MAPTDRDLSPLGELTVAAFLADHWQKRPLLVRRAFSGPPADLSPEELAGLACEPDVESRLVLERGKSPWEVRHGPFEASEFTELPASHWTLLVNAVDRHVPEVARLLERFRFVPNWRIDDVMVSYAPEHGSVGPHVDNYDVFLVQGSGRRRWGIERDPSGEERLLPLEELRVLERFEPEEEWVLDPGDLLYLPPRIPHHGVAVEPCMTYSIGFRAPSVVDLAAAWVGYLGRTVGGQARYADPDLVATADPGEIRPEAIERIAGLLVDRLADLDDVARWFGESITEETRGRPEEPSDRLQSADDVSEALRAGAVLQRSAVPRFAFFRRPDGRVWLFVGGACYDLAPSQEALARLLTGTVRLDSTTIGSWLEGPESASIVVDLLHRGSLRLEDDEP